ncbi:hypothetical protein F4777DRAFT_561478 [Nemania sp. FL0916]|nr:hypothetical protein F4777DRAFT_561478 [Nemania sp. FL0916]
MSRSSLSIRKLITSRRLSDEDLREVELKKNDSLLALWMEQDGGSKIYAPSRSSRPSSRKKQAPAPIIATSPLTHSDILRPLPPLPIETPRSSASSSCKCEIHDECDCPLLSWKRRSPVYSLSLNEGSGDTQLLSCINTNDPDDTLTHHIPKSRFYLSNEVQNKGDIPRALSPTEKCKEERTKDQPSAEASSQALSDDLQQFMQETEDAFKAIGNTFVEVPEPPPPPPPPKEVPISKKPPVITQPTPDSPPKSPPKDDTPPPIPPKMKRPKKSKQAKPIKSARKSMAPKQAVKIVPRWTLTENVSELFIGKLFHRAVEPDEMLTPEQIEAFKQKRITENQVDKMAEALEQELVVTPTEPFYLDELPSRIGSADVQTGKEASAEEKPVTPPSEDVVSRDFSVESQDDTEPPPIPPKLRPPFHNSKAVPTTSSRHVRSSSRKLVTELPIIPEISATPRKSDELYSSNESNDSLASAYVSEYVYFKSPSYSLTTPTIRHGPIRLSRSDVLPDMKLGGDEGLDWTAFQMAILGGAGDFFSDSDDVLRQMETDEILDITEWWDSWHFESTGDLVTRKYRAPSPASTLSGDDVPDLSYSEIESDNSHSPEHKGRAPHYRKSRVPSLQLDTDFTRGKKHNSLSSHYFADTLNNTNTNTNATVAISDAWQRDNTQHKQAAEVNRQSIISSLPPSPMLDLRIIRSDNGDDMDVVPMGYNLGHDLGDFLKWEAEHAYAGDFHSPP